MQNQARKIKRGSRLSKTEVKQIEEQLLQERERTLRQIALWRDQSAVCRMDSSRNFTFVSDHMADVASDTMELEKMTYMISVLTVKVRSIDEALRNLYRKQSYGVCRSCEKPIDKKRLRAIPYTYLCVPCKTQQEA